MRVLHLGKFFPPEPGGIERFSAELMAALHARGVDQAALVHAAPGTAGWQRRFPGPDGALVAATRCLGRALFVPVSPGWPGALSRLLRQFRPDLLHVHAPNPSAFCLLASPAARRLPWLLHWHADVPHDARHRGIRLAYPAYRGLERRLLARSASVVATSEAYAAASPALAGLGARLSVVPLGLGDAPPAGSPPAWPGEGLRLLAVGRLSYYKGFPVLLDALARTPGANLVLVGDGEQGAALRAEAVRLGVAERVRFAGTVDDATLEAAYRACDLVCLPSLDRAEAFGMVLLEAMRAGRPALASDIPGSGVGDVLGRGEAGLLVPPGDADALAAALGRLRDDAALRDRLGSVGRERFAAHYRIDVVAGRLQALYGELVPEPAA